MRLRCSVVQELRLRRLVTARATGGSGVQIRDHEHKHLQALQSWNLMPTRTQSEGHARSECQSEQYIQSNTIEAIESLAFAFPSCLLLVAATRLPRLLDHSDQSSQRVMALLHLSSWVKTVVVPRSSPQPAMDTAHGIEDAILIHNIFDIQNKPYQSRADCQL